MTYQAIYQLAKLLPRTEQLQLIVNLTQDVRINQGESLGSRRNSLINKQGSCPHCAGVRYFRYGTARGAQRFKCKDCGRTFCEYTGTWLEGIHKKSLVEPYLELMLNHCSLEKTRKELCINKKTAFDWQHKILSSIEQDTGNQFVGIVESDETFFERSEKVTKSLERPARKRGIQLKDIGKITSTGFICEKN